MTDEGILTEQEVARLRRVAAILLPGHRESPSATSLPDLDVWMMRAVKALGSEAVSLRGAISSLPADLDWDQLRQFSLTHPDAFEVISAAVAGAYFMSPAVLQSIGYPTGPRRPARSDLVVDELETGVLEPVISRGSMVRVPPGASPAGASSKDVSPH